MAEKEFKEIQRSLNKHELVLRSVVRLRDMLMFLESSKEPVEVVLRLQGTLKAISLDKHYALEVGLTGADLRELLESKLVVAEARLKEIEARLEAVTLLLR